MGAIIIAGKTCSGKSTLANLLEDKYGIERIRTYTTRPKRDGETNEYYFENLDKFLDLEANGFFIETTSYHVASDEIWHYGTPRIPFMDETRLKCVVLNPVGAKKVVSFCRMMRLDAPVVFYLNVPKSILFERLLERGDDSEEALRRLEADEKDFQDFVYDHSLSNGRGADIHSIAKQLLGFL